MIKVYLDSNEIFRGLLGRSLVGDEAIVDNLNTRFGVNGWTSFIYSRINNIDFEYFNKAV